MITSLDRRAGLCARGNPAPSIFKHAAIVGANAFIRTKGDKAADHFRYLLLTDRLLCLWKSHGHRGSVCLRE
jgi:hypothetical protein